MLEARNGHSNHQEVMKQVMHQVPIHHTYITTRANRRPHIKNQKHYKHAEHVWGERSKMMLAHDIVGKKEEDTERQYGSLLKCIVLKKVAEVES